MSGPAILAQAIPAFVSLGPAWRKPTLCQAQFTTATSGTATMVDAETSRGVSVAESGVTDGLYTLTFPACKNFKLQSWNVAPATPATASNARHLYFDEPAASSGTVVFRSLAANGGALSSPNDTSTVTILFWLDLG
jgi:hypothetical protein